MIGHGFAYGVQSRGAVGPSIPTTVPADWRMPATVTTSAGLASAATALNTAQASASAKTRPSATVLAGATDHIEWTVGAAGIAILSWLGQSAGTATVTKNGANQSFTTAVPSGSTIDGVSGTGGRRQFMRLSVAAGDTIRLTIAAGVADRTIRPLLHKLPDAGPWDAHLVVGASREAQGLGCQLIEDAVIAAYPTRDPIVFNWAVSGASLGDVQAQATGAAPIYAGTAPYAIIGSAAGNNITGGRPYTSGQKAALDSGFTAICTTLTGAGMILGFGNTSYRAYTSAPAVTPADQSGGSLPYNDNVVHPMIATYAAHCYDASLKRSRIDDYLHILFNRVSLTDEVHGAYTQMCAHWAVTWFNYVAAGTWPASQIEQRVASAEANATTKATALSAFNEAGFAMAALEATSTKTALQARLDAINATVLFYEAVRLIDAAVAAVSQPTKDAAQTGLNAAVSAGYTGGTAPNTVAAQQARIDAIVIAAYDQTVNVGFGSTSAVTGWNRLAPGSSTGVIASGLLDASGATTALGLNVTDAGTGNSSNTAQTSLVAGIPDAVLGATWTETSTGLTFEITGLDPAKLYTLWLMPSRTTGTASLTRFIVNGVTQSPEISPVNNVSNYLVVANVAPSAGGVITVRAQRGVSGSFAYMTVLRLLRQA